MKLPRDPHNPRRGPWWLTDVVVPLVIVLMFLLAYGLLGGLIDGPVQQ